MNNNEIRDRISLKDLVDRVSVLGDRKDFTTQVNLFTEDAVSETFLNGTLIMKLKGRKEMSEAFEQFLKEFEIVYHFNGQQVLTITGDNTAIGTCYSLVTLIGNENGKQTTTDMGVIYSDDYIRENKQWLIAKRIGNFRWQNKIIEENASKRGDLL